MGYLQGEGQNLSGFSQFVEKAEVILRKLRVSNIRVGDGRTQEKSKGMYGFMISCSVPPPHLHSRTILFRLSRFQATCVSCRVRNIGYAPKPLRSPGHAGFGKGSDLHDKE